MSNLITREQVIEFLMLANRDAVGPDVTVVQVWESMGIRYRQIEFLDGTLWEALDRASGAVYVHRVASKGGRVLRGAVEGWLSQHAADPDVWELIVLPTIVKGGVSNG